MVRREALDVPAAIWEFNKVTQQAAKACGMDYIVLWNASLPKAYIRYAQGDKLKPGDIILTHWRPDLYKHLPRALKDIQQRGSRSQLCRTTFLVARSSGTGAAVCHPIRRECAKLTGNIPSTLLD